MEHDRKLTYELADFLASVTYGDLPTAVREESLRVIYDTLLCAIAGQAAPASEIVARTMLALDEGGSIATVLGLDTETSPSTAAFVNALAANALDLDDNLLYHSHIANTVVSAALAAAEQTDASGRDLLTAVAVGYEAAARVTLSMPGIQYLADGPEGPEIREWHDPWGYSYNTIGGAVAAGVLYGVTGLQMRDLLGLAAYASPVPSGTRASARGGHPLSKYGAYGWQASAAVTSAALAANGYTADDDVFDGPGAYWRMVGAPGYLPEALVRELGQHWWLPLTSYKTAPAGTWMRPALWAVQGLLAEPGFDPARIEGIEVSTRLLRKGGEGSNVFASGRPRTYNDTQVSYRYLIAVTVLGVSPDRWQLPEVFRDDAVNRLIDRIVLVADPEADEQLKAELREFPHRPNGVRTSVRVRMASGKIFENEARYGDGDPFSDETRITNAKLTEKFDLFAAPQLRQSRPHAVSDSFWSLDEPGVQVRGVMAELRSCSAA